MKNLFRVLRIMFVLLVLLLIVNTNVVRAEKLNTDKYEPRNENVPSEITEIGGVVYNSISTLGIMLAVATLIILGIKYMMGSVEEKANYKKTMIPYIIGAVLVASGSTIIIIIQELVR